MADTQLTKTDAAPIAPPDRPAMAYRIEISALPSGEKHASHMYRIADPRQYFEFYKKVEGGLAAVHPRAPVMNKGITLERGNDPVELVVSLQQYWALKKDRFVYVRLLGEVPEAEAFPPLPPVTGAKFADPMDELRKQQKDAAAKPAAVAVGDDDKGKGKGGK